jgi:hypothetical protein
LTAGTFVFNMLAPVVVYLLLTRRRLRAPAAFQRPDDATFTAAGSPAAVGILGIMLMLQAGNLVPFDRIPGTDRIGLPTDPALLALIALPVALVAAAFAVLWLPGPAVRLTPAGFAWRSAVRWHMVSWDDLLTGGPAPVRGWRMRLEHRGPDGAPARSLAPAALLYVDSVFIATVVRHYAEHPEHRADIGTRTELDRLEAGYRTWQAVRRDQSRTGDRAAVVRS